MTSRQERGVAISGPRHVADTTGAAWRFSGIDHVQLAMPTGGEEAAESFYAALLGLSVVPKPPELASRGGCWFAQGGTRIHLGVETDFQPARKAHPAIMVEGLESLVRRLEAAGVRFLPAVTEVSLAGATPLRGYIEDCFGNRIELIDAAPS